MSPDGTMMCGWAEWDDGTRSPAVWKDGKMVRLIGTEPAISNPDKWEEFYEGPALLLQPRPDTSRRILFRKPI